MDGAAGDGPPSKDSAPRALGDNRDIGDVGNAAAADVDATAEAAAEARGRGYHLLARLLAHGPTPALRAEAATIPALAAALPPPGDPDAVSADHHALFGFDILPYEGVFRDPDGLLGGPVTAAVAAAYAAAGWAPPDDGESPDHVAVELAFLAWLAAGEADALRAGDAARMARLVAARREFVTGHALRWWPALAAALEAMAAGAESAAFHAGVLGLAVALAADHGSDTEGESVAGSGSDDAGEREREAGGERRRGAERASGSAAERAEHVAAASAADALLADPRTGLRDIARFLTSPARAGAYLGRGAVTRAARAAGVPHGFGDRRIMLGDALAAAAHLERVGPLARALDAEVAAQAQAVEGWRQRAREAGWAELERALAGWAARGDGCRGVLARVAEQGADGVEGT